MDEIVKDALRLASLIPNHTADTCKPCLSLKYGDVSLGRCTTITTSEEELRELCSRHENDVFTEAKINPQGQLCLSLNRPIAFQRCIPNILKETTVRCCHGNHAECSQQPVLVMHHSNLPRLSRSADGNEGGMTGSPRRCQRQLSVSEARIILIGDLTHSILKTTDYTPIRLNHHLTSMMKGQDDDIKKFLNSSSSFPSSNFSNSVGNKNGEKIEEEEEKDEEEKIEETIEEGEGEEKEEKQIRKSVEEFLKKIESSPYVTCSVRGSVCSAKQFLLRNGRPDYYDSNIDTIRVRGEEGHVTDVSYLAYQIYTEIRSGGGGGGGGDHPATSRAIHVTSQTDSFKLQQALVLNDIIHSNNTSELHLPPPTHHHHLHQQIIQCSHVEVSEGDTMTKDYPLNKLLEQRRKLMTQAFRVKHGDIAETDDGIQAMVWATTEAVVKFELLSTDLHSKVKLRVPEEEGEGEDDRVSGHSSDVRFAGSFVLYNYARLAGLVRNFETACQNGTYPPLPEMSKIDFSLLTDEEEWVIFYQYILQYPVLVSELADNICHSFSVRCRIKLKKVCQYLHQLSHSVSTYYSRVKILMVPEPHLIPLIHARLMLVLAIKQTLYSGLKLLAIEPPLHL